MQNKLCTKCEIIKPITEFYFSKNNKNNVMTNCKKCDNKRKKNYFHSKQGLITRIYSDQKKSAYNRNYAPPTYSKEMLREWLLTNLLFNQLYNNWILSNFNRWLTPSCDRKNDYKSYTLDNLQLVTWKENNDKSHKDRKEGRNNKMSKSILQYDINENFIKEYYSTMSIERDLGIYHGHISNVCKGKNKTAGGYIWKYKNI